MKRSIPQLLIAIAISGAVAACSGLAGAPSHSSLDSASGSPASQVPPAAASSGVDPSGRAASSLPAPEPSATDPTASAPGYRVTYDWAVPSKRVTIPHEVHAPIAPAPALPLPALVAVYVGEHPEGDPQYQRISFYFRGAFPEYNLQYVRSLTAEGSGATIHLDGNGVIQVGFVSAQAHDNAGASTVQVTPKNPIGFQNLKGYALAGDFEGYVTYGLGIQAAVDSDQVLRVRAGELRKPDGVGGFFYVVAIDVQNG